MPVRDTLITDLQLVGLGVYTSGFFAIARSIERAADRLENFNEKQVLFAAAGALAATKTIRFLRDAAVEAGNFQAKQQAFTTLFRGNSQAADMFLGRLQQFALTSSFTLNQTSQLTQQLIAMGFSAEETIPIMQRLGDATVALGGDPEKLDRLVLAIGQIRTRGKLVQQELNQLSQAGFPVADLLDKMGLTGTQKGNIGREGIESGVALKAIFDLIDERMGGGMQRRLETMPGQIDQIKDAWEGVLRVTGKPIAEGVVPVLKQISGLLMNIAQGGDAAGKTILGASLGGLALAGGYGYTLFKNFRAGGGVGGALARGAMSAGFGGMGGNVGVMNVTAGVVNVGAAASAAGLASAVPAGMTMTKSGLIVPGPLAGGTAGSVATGTAATGTAAKGPGFLQRLLNPSSASMMKMARFGGGGAAVLGGLASRSAFEGDFFGTMASNAFTGAGAGFMLTGTPHGAAIGGVLGGVVGMFDSIFQENAKARETEQKLAQGREQDMLNALNKITSNTDVLKDIRTNTFRPVGGGSDLYRPLPGAYATALANAEI